MKSNLLGRFFYAQKSVFIGFLAIKLRFYSEFKQYRQGITKNYPKESRGVCTITTKNIKTPEKSVLIELFGGSFLFRWTVMGLKIKLFNFSSMSIVGVTRENGIYENYKRQKIKLSLVLLNN